MPSRIEDYALMGIARRLRSSPTTARSTGCAGRGSTRRRALRRCSATQSHGRWLIAPAVGGLKQRSAVATRRNADPRNRVQHRRRHGAVAD